MITFTDVVGDAFQASATIQQVDGVNGEKSLTGVVYFGDDVKNNIGRGWSLEFDGDTYVVTIHKRNDQDNTVSISAVQEFFYRMNRTGFAEEWNGSHTWTAYLDALFADTPFTYDNKTDVAAFEKQNWGMSDRLSLFNGLIDQANVEFYVDGSVVHILPTIGTNLATIVRKRFNLNTAEIQTDNSTFATYGRGFGAFTDPDDETKGRLTVEYKSPLYDYYAQRWGAIEATPVVDERYTDADSLLAAVKSEVDNGYSISLTLNVIDLQAAGYPTDMPSAGDTITVIDEDVNFNDEVRIVKITSDYDINGKRTNVAVECGSASFADQARANVVTPEKVEELAGSLREQLKAESDKRRAEADAESAKIEQELADNRTYYDQRVSSLSTEMASEYQKAQDRADALDASVATAQQAAIDAAHKDLTDILGTYKGDVDKQLTEYNDGYDLKLTTLDKSVTDLTTSVEGVQAKYTDLQTDVTAKLDVMSGTITQSVADAKDTITAATSTQIKDGLASITERVTDAEGNITELTTLAKGLQTTVTDGQSDMQTKFTQLSDAVTAKVSDDNLQSLFAVQLKSVTAQITDDEGKLAEMGLTVDGLQTTLADNQTDTESKISQLSDMIDLRATSADVKSQIDVAVKGLNASIESVDGKTVSLGATIDKITGWQSTVEDDMTGLKNQMTSTLDTWNQKLQDTQTSLLAQIATQVKNGISSIDMDVTAGVSDGYLSIVANGKASTVWLGGDNLYLTGDTHVEGDFVVTQFNQYGQVQVDPTGLHILDDYNNEDMGYIHANNIVGHDNINGLQFDLNKDGDYMGWGWRANDTDDYTLALSYWPKTNSATSNPKGLKLDDDLTINSKYTAYLSKIGTVDFVDGRTYLSIQNQTYSGNLYPYWGSQNGNAGILYGSGNIYAVQGGKVDRFVTAAGAFSPGNNSYHTIHFGTQTIDGSSTKYPALMAEEGKVGILFGTGELYLVSQGIVHSVSSLL